MTYLEYFDPASERDEAEYVLSFNYKVEMTCFTESVYPFKIFPEKYFSHAEFAPITVFYGGNGSGKSTFLNIVAEKLGLIRKAPFNRTPYFEEYLSYCRYGLTRSYLPSESRIITSEIKEDALYLLDEPENSLSAEYQLELARFLEDSARFYGCQFIIATHSPFILSMKGAKIYDLDARPVCDKRWTELPNVRVYRDFFRSHEDEFK